MFLPVFFSSFFVIYIFLYLSTQMVWDGFYSWVCSNPRP